MTRMTSAARLAGIVAYPKSNDPHAPTLSHVRGCAECSANAAAVAKQDREANTEN